jgi:hypothetical protein
MSVVSRDVARIPRALHIFEQAEKPSALALTERDRQFPICILKDPRTHGFPEGLFD